MTAVLENANVTIEESPTIEVPRLTDADLERLYVREIEKARESVQVRVEIQGFCCGIWHTEETGYLQMTPGYSKIITIDGKGHEVSLGADGKLAPMQIALAGCQRVLFTQA